MSFQIKNVKQINAKAKTHEVAFYASDRGLTDYYHVTSSNSGNVYTVRISGNVAFCDCDWSKYRPGHDRRCACSHVQSVYKFIAEQKNRATSAWGNIADAERQHRQIINIGDGVILTTRKAG